MESKTLTTAKLKELQGPKVRFKQPLLGATIPRNLMSIRRTVTEKSVSLTLQIAYECDPQCDPPLRL